MNVKDVKIDSSKVDTSKNGTYKVTYTISDSFNKNEILSNSENTKDGYFVVSKMME